MVAGRRGFTLVEMLLVVAIISLLIAILLPSMRSARDEARAAACAAKHHAWATAFEAYWTDQYYLPLFADKYDVTGANPLEISTLWFNSTAPYIGLERVTADMSAAAKSAAHERNYNADVRRCPADAAVYIGVNYGGFNSSKPTWAPINYGRNVGPEGGITRTRLGGRNPSRWMMLCDTNAHFIYTPRAWTRTVDFDGDGTPDSHPGVLGIEGSVNYYNRGRPTVHQRSGPYGFIDGHVQRLTFAEWLDSEHWMWTGK